MNIMKRARAKTKKRPRRLAIANFRFVGAGSTRQGRLSPVSERHDEALVEVFSGEKPEAFRRYLPGE
jgi:hypothetical protein